MMALIRIQIKTEKGWTTLIEGEYKGEVKAISEIEALFKPSDPRIAGGIIRVEKVKEEKEEESKKK
jgi:hypothetical protein